jgi:hypothetical protein
MRLAHVLACLAVATGCSVDRGETSPETATLSTVQGASDPAACVNAAAAAIDITILDSNERSVARFQQSCNAFATSVDLVEGIYAAEARLIGDGGIARTRAVRIDFFTINATSQLTEPVDFPESAFLVRSQ